MSNFNHHVKSDRRKWIAVAVAFVLIAAVIITGCLTDWFTNWGKYITCDHYFDENGICVKCGAERLDETEKDPSVPDEKEPEEKDPAPERDAAINGGGYATVLPGNGINLLAAKLQTTVGVPASVAENTWTLRASVNEHADDKYINWSVRWKDAQASWAQGKTVTDYLTVTPIADGALSATVKVVKDFGAQIEVVATSRDNPEKSAVCLFDYVQKITGITFTMPQVSSETTTFSYEFQTTAYTVASEQKLTIGSQMKTSSAFNTAMENALIENAENSASIHDNMHSGNDLFVFSPTITSEENSLSLVSPQLPDRCELRGDGLCGYFYGFGQDRDSLSYFYPASVMLYCFRQAISNTQTAHATFDVTFTATYNGKTYSSGSKTIEVKFDGEAIHVPVSDVTLDQSHIYA